MLYYNNGVNSRVNGHGYIWLNAMSDYVQDLDLVVKAFVDNDIEIDDNGRCYIVNLVYLNEEDDPSEARVDLEGVIENLIEYHNDLQGYQSLYAVAHELARHAERLRDVAGRVEDSEDVARSLFDVDD